MSETELMYNKFFFLTDRTMPSLQAIDVAVPFYSEKRSKNVEFAMLSAFLEIVFGSHLYYSMIMESSSQFRSRKTRVKKSEKGCFFRFSLESGFLDRFSFLYSIFFFKILAQEKRDLVFFLSSFQTIFRDLEMGSFFLGDHKVNLSFKFHFDCRAWSEKGHGHIAYLLPYLSGLYGLGTTPRIYRDEFDFLKRER